jgi:ATP/maltotriose-dependent transcriptional regulator MalT
MNLREKVKGLAEDASGHDPGNNDFKRGYAFSLTGVSGLQAQMGRLDLAEINLRKAVAILRQLYAADPSNVNYRKLMVHRQVMLADLLQESGQPAGAWALIQDLKAETEAGGILAIRADSSPKETINFLLVLAKIELHSGNTATANATLREALKLQMGLAVSTSWDRFDKVRLQKMSYQWWEGNGHEGLAEFTGPHALGQGSSGEYQSCMETDYEARMHLIRGDRETAASLVKYLEGRGYSAQGGTG